MRSDKRNTRYRQPAGAHNLGYRTEIPSLFGLLKTGGRVVVVECGALSVFANPGSKGCLVNVELLKVLRAHEC